MAQTKTKTKAKATSKGRSSSSRKPSSSRKRTNSSSKAAPTEVMSNAADKATTAVGHAADKAKIPLVAGGAAIAGAAGGAMLSARQARRKRSTAARLGDFALQMQRARQTPNGSKQRSPVEVVLEGLTSRRSRA
jgi:hypothetical protein